MISSRRWFDSAALLVALTVGAGGCAAHRSNFSGRFIKPGSPALKLPAGAQPPVENSVRDFIRKARELQVRAHPKPSLAATLENTDPFISKQLLLLAMDDTADRHVAIADAYRKAGVTDFAYRHYQRATALDPCSGSGFDGMARLWRDWGRPDIAIGDSYRALHCSPQSSELYNTLGTIMAALGQTSNARDAYNRAIALDAHSAPALTNLGYLELQAGNSAEALRLSAEAVSTAPEFEPARNNLALVYVSRGDYQAAERVLEQGQTATASYNLGVLRLATGNYRLAAEAFDQASMLQPSMKMARARAVQARRAAEAGDRANGINDQR